MQPNWRKDSRKSKPRDGHCAITHCDGASVITYYGLGICTIHMDYYFAEDMPHIRLKDVLRIPVTDEARASSELHLKKEKAHRRVMRKLESEEIFDEFELEMFKENTL